MNAKKRQAIFIGTYSSRGSEGLYRAWLDADAGRLSDLQPAAPLSNPTFQAMHPAGNFLYSVSEERNEGRRMHGSVNAFEVAPETGRLKLLNKQLSKGDGPCHLCVDARGRHLFVANYASGSAAVFPIAKNGAIGEATSFVQHRGGSGVIPGRQDGPHAHSVTLSPDNRFAFAADLGMDRIMAYRLDAGSGALLACDPPDVAGAPGSGPRHMAFHPGGRHAYLVNELGNSVTAFQYEVARGILKPIQTISSLPENWSGTTSAADIHVSPDGRHLYASNRGHDSLACYEIEEISGMLVLKDFLPCGGRCPRNFLLAENGTLMLIANAESDSVSVFRVNSDTGGITPSGAPLQVPAPVCLTA